MLDKREFDWLKNTMPWRSNQQVSKKIFYVNSITIMQNWKNFWWKPQRKTFWKQWYATYEQKPYLKFDNAMRKICCKTCVTTINTNWNAVKDYNYAKFFFEI